MTLIEIRPHGNGWKVFEASGVELEFPEKDHAMDYAQSRVCFSFRYRCSAFGFVLDLLLSM